MAKANRLLSSQEFRREKNATDYIETTQQQIKKNRQIAANKSLDQDTSYVNT